MSVDVSPIRPVARWLHVWAILTVIVAAVLLGVGGLVTTFRAGMADKAWPTRPDYLIQNDWKGTFEFLVEHSHRLLGFIVGGVTIILALGLWWTDPSRWSRWLGLIGLIAMQGAYGLFHRVMMKQVDSSHIEWPTEVIGVTVGLFGFVLLLGLISLATGARGAGLRVLGTVTLAAVMIQGLLGGLRVRLHALVGPDLAPIHGVFAQTVFCCMVALAVLTAKASAVTQVDNEGLSRCRRLAVLLTLLVFIQLIWGALVRHNPTDAAQRLHLITAFAVVATAVWLIRSAAGLGLLRVRVILAVLLALQVMFGVEAWMGKFASGILPETQQITNKIAALRTAHMLIGSGILATSVAFVLLSRRPVELPRPAEPEFTNPDNDDTLVCPAPADSHRVGGAV